jgi:nitroreductase
MRLRQIALVARELEPVVADLCAVLGVEECFRDPGVAEFGLHNALMPIGTSFLEVVSPMRAGTTAGRLLERRGGDGGYMVIVQTDDLAADRKRIDELGIRVVWQVKLPDAQTIHLHPRDVGAAIVSLDAMIPPESWRWAGPEWRKHVRSDVTRALAGAELQSADPAALAARWGQVSRIRRSRRHAGWRSLRQLRQRADGRGEGVAASTSRWWRKLARSPRNAGWRSAATRSRSAGRGSGSSVSAAGCTLAMSTLRAVRRLRRIRFPRRSAAGGEAAAWAPPAGTSSPAGGARARCRPAGVRELYREPWARYAAMSRKATEALPAERRASMERTLAAGDHLAAHFHETPVIAVFCFNPAHMAITDAGLDRPSVVGGGSVYPSVQNFLLAARAEGLGCVLTTLLCQREKQVKALLGIPAEWGTCAAVPLGYPASRGHGPLSRRPVEKLAFADRWGVEYK